MVSYGLSGLYSLANLLSQDLTDVGGKTQQLDSHRFSGLLSEEAKNSGLLTGFAKDRSRLGLGRTHFGR